MHPSRQETTCKTTTRKGYTRSITSVVEHGLVLGRLHALSLSAGRFADVLLGWHGVVDLPAHAAGVASSLLPGLFGGWPPAPSPLPPVQPLSRSAMAERARTISNM
eukprot:6212642-Pleurochrysis_carterae.AAC.3